MTDHYQVLGVRRRATEAEIKAAFRALAREHHPDVAGPGSAARFVEIKEAYEVLSDPGRRNTYDAALTYTENILRQQQEAAARAASQSQRREYFQEAPREEPKTEKPKPASGGADILRLTTLFRSGRLKEAEEKAMDILAANPQQPVALAVVADIARMRGNLAVAQKYYALAAQYDPSSAIYVRRQQEMVEAMGQMAPPEKESTAVRTKPAEGGRPGALGFAAVIIFGAMVFAAAFRDQALRLPLVPAWGPSMLFSLAFSGLILGAMLSASNAVGRFRVTQGGTSTVAPGAVLALLAVLNFWLAALFYLVVGSIQRAMNESLLRLLGSVSVIVVLFGLAAFSRSLDMLWQTLLWGGNIVYLAAVAGWFVADALRPRA